MYSLIALCNVQYSLLVNFLTFIFEVLGLKITATNQLSDLSSLSLLAKWIKTRKSHFLNSFE